MITQPGIYTIPAAEYHTDPCPQPSLSASIAKILIQDSPLHAWYAHPRLNPSGIKEEARHFDLGTICHALMLEGRDVAVVIDAENYRTKAAQEQRDAARMVDKCPVLVHEMAEVDLMVKSCRRQLDAHADASDAFTDGRPEQTVVWQEPDIWCRIRPDWLHDDLRFIDDYKTTSVSANPENLRRPIFANGWDLRAAMYLRGLAAVNEGSNPETAYRFIVQETFAPFALSVVTLDANVMLLAERKLERALAKWRQCLATNTWPGYPPMTAVIELPPWESEKEYAQNVE